MRERLQLGKGNLIGPSKNWSPEVITVPYRKIETTYPVFGTV
jgi:hypothetical protein